ncbi:chemotaxis protein CheB [Pedobacter sp. NJ-S-72]
MDASTNKQYIIAIGASAGGLDAIAAFFDYTPLDAVSYILIQHLSPCLPFSKVRWPRYSAGIVSSRL